MTSPGAQSRKTPLASLLLPSSRLCAEPKRRDSRMAIRTLHRHVITSMVAVLTLLAFGPPAHAQWSGWARCRIVVTGTGYTSDETQTWIVRNAIGNSPATWGSGDWHVSGKGTVDVHAGPTKGEWAINGLRTDLSFAVEESVTGGQVTVKIDPRHAPTGQPRGTAGYIERAPTNFEAGAPEWAFPTVQGSASSSPPTTLSNVSGSTTTGSSTWGYRPASVSGATESVTCSWDFVSGSTPASPTPVDPVCVPDPPTRVKLDVFSVVGQAANQPNARVAAPSCYKLISGGVRSNWHVHGSLLTGSTPGGAPGGAAPIYWYGKAKDHYYPDPTTVTVYGIGLRDGKDAWEVTHWQQASRVSSSSPLVRVNVGPGYAMTGGGCFVDPGTPPGLLLTASFPSSTTTWECRARAHIKSSQARLTAYVVGIRPRDGGRPLPTVQITSETSMVGSYVQAKAPAAAGHVITGGGALTLLADPPGTSAGFATLADPLLTGQLLTGSYPDGLVPNVWRASAKDHIYSSKGRVRAFAVNVKIN